MCFRKKGVWALIEEREEEEAGDEEGFSTNISCWGLRRLRGGLGFYWGREGGRG